MARRHTPVIRHRDTPTGDQYWADCDTCDWTTLSSPTPERPAQLAAAHTADPDTA